MNTDTDHDVTVTSPARRLTPAWMAAVTLLGCQLDYEGGLLNVNIDTADGAIALNIGEERGADAPQDDHDSDGDGVGDGVDLCPDVPEGDDWSFAYGDGCPADWRSDGGTTDPGPDAGTTAASGSTCAAPNPAGESCNGLDDDCDGYIDEDLGLGLPCVVGTGACARPGNNECALDAMPVG